MKAIGFHIQKGGCGKTTLTGTISFLLSETHKTLLIDGDGQGSLSSWFIKDDDVSHELADVLIGNVDVKEAVVELKNNLFIIPTFSIDGRLKNYGETKLFNEPFIFDDLNTELNNQGFEYVLYDLSPGMSHLEKCILLALDEVIVPLTPEYFSMDGIQIFNSELIKIQKSFRKDVSFKKIVVNNINRSFRRHKESLSLIEKLDYDFYYISQDSKIAEGQFNNQTIFQYHPSSKTIPEFQRLAKAIMEE